MLATGRGRARQVARALRHGHVAPDDLAPSDAVSRGYFDAATFAIYQRLRDLQRDRGRPQRVEEPVSEHPASPPPAARRPRRQRAPKPPPATAVAAGAAAGAASPIGLFRVHAEQSASA